MMASWRFPFKIGALEARVHAVVGIVHSSWLAAPDMRPVAPCRGAACRPDADLNGRQEQLWLCRRWGEEAMHAARVRGDFPRHLGVRRKIGVKR